MTKPIAFLLFIGTAMAVAFTIGKTVFLLALLIAVIIVAMLFLRSED